MEDGTRDHAQAALDAIGHARSSVTDQIGLPRGYWWTMAAAWIVLGALADFSPAWVVTIATVGVGLAHSICASQLLDGRRASSLVRINRSAVSPRVPLAVVAILLAFVGLTIAAAVLLHADHAHHAALWAAVLVACVVGFGGADILRVTRRMLRA